jgi:hypothetical protein
MQLRRPGLAIGREVSDEADLGRYGRVEVFEELSRLGGGDELRIASEPGNELAEASHVAI